MKINYLLIITAAGLALAGCNTEPDCHNVFYISGTEENPATRLYVESTAETGVSVSSSAIVDNDVRITLAIDNSKVDYYNNVNGTGYRPLPAENYRLDTTAVTIKTGQNVSNTVKLSIRSLDGLREGVTYCIPLSISSVENGDGKVLEASRTKYIVIGQVIRTKAAQMAPNYWTVDFSGDQSLRAVNRVTYEARVYINSYNPKSSEVGIATIMGMEENFILRFGDSEINPDQLQIAKESYKAASATGLPARTWHHVAAVFDGTQYLLYWNGKLQGATPVPYATLDFMAPGQDNNRFKIGASTQGNSRKLDALVSEMRVWKKALTPNDMLNNMCYTDPTADGLLAYWRFNGTDDRGNIPDLTGHGFDAKPNRTVIFTPGIKCPDVNNDE
jgi:hypothetical protein